MNYVKKKWKQECSANCSPEMNVLILAFVCWNLVLIDLTFGQEFEAGSFILTQNSLNEAPYRYAGVLRKILDKVEKKDPPSQSDEENCNAKYRIKPSGNLTPLDR